MHLPQVPVLLVPTLLHRLKATVLRLLAALDASEGHYFRDPTSAAFILFISSPLLASLLTCTSTA